MTLPHACSTIHGALAFYSAGLCVVNMSPKPVRIGIIGAGRDIRINLIPGWQAMDGVEVVGVANRSRASSQRVAEEFGIPKVYDTWQELVTDPDTNAICIGTFPDTHCRMTLATLAANKHVLCESRMSRTGEEARAMLLVARSKPGLVAQIVPAPATFQVDNIVLDQINSGALGKLLSVDMWVGRSIDNQLAGGFIDQDSPLDWRQDWDVHGYNALGLGIAYEALVRWVGPATRVLANSKTFVPARHEADGTTRAVRMPDHIDVLCDMACGATAHIAVSQATGLAPYNQSWIFGSEGTLRIASSLMTSYRDREAESTGIDVPGEAPVADAGFRDDVHYRDHHKLRAMVGRRGDAELTELPNPEEAQYRWRVAEEFVNAIRGLEPVTRTSFEVGVQYMELLEAVALSARAGRAVHLPLA